MGQSRKGKGVVLRPLLFFKVPKLTVTQDLAGLRARMSELNHKEFPKALAFALTDTGADVVKAEVRTAKEVFHNPTPFVVAPPAKSGGSRAFALKFAKDKDFPKPAAEVRIKDIQAQFLHHQIVGGTRFPKKRAIAVPNPKNLPLNKFGNMTRNKVKTMLANKTKYFSGKPRGGKHGGEGGIYQRTGGKRSPAFKQVVSWQPRTLYSKRFPFYEVGEKIIRQFFGNHLNRQLIKATKRIAKRMGKA